VLFCRRRALNAVLIAGCGDVGRRVAAQYLDRGIAVTGLVSSPASANLLTADGIMPRQVDLDAAMYTPFDIEDGGLFYFAPPPATGDSDPRLERFLDALNGRPRKLVYISTSGVYGDCGGAWIDETAPVNPRTPRARRRAAAEQAVREWSARSGAVACILRVPGIYGPGRLPVERLRRGLPILRAEDSPYTNRIHADDLATAAIAAMERGEPGAVYNISDGNPTTMGDYFNRVADLLGLPRPPEVPLTEARTSLTAEMMSFLEESKRLITTCMREELGVTPRYPDLDHGLPSCLPA
jgi:nucleoside-diphosphate-sugar epimerase